MHNLTLVESKDDFEISKLKNKANIGEILPI